MSRFKPGQLVTIDHTVYRIKKSKSYPLGTGTCAQCAFNTPVTKPQPAICCYCLEELGWRGYFEQVYPKR